MSHLTPDDLQVTPEDLNVSPATQRVPGRSAAPIEIGVVPGDADRESSPVDDDAPLQAVGGGLLTIPLVCLGLGLVAMCLIIPAADDNRRLVWQREKLSQDLAQIQKQTAINDEFLARLAGDPSLAQRLAQRQMKLVRQGESILQLRSQAEGVDMSPFGLVQLPPPPPMPEYKPVGGRVTRWFHDPKVNLYLLGSGMLVLVLGIVLGSNQRR